MNLFFAADLSADTLTLEGEEFRHCVQSFRQKAGDRILLTDGKGTRAEAQIDELRKRSLSLTIEKRETPGSGRPYTLEIAIAPTKNSNRVEWFVEKSVELGIDSISFITTKHSERRKIRLDRMKRIALAAVKQSRQFTLPTISKLEDLSTYLNDHPVIEQQEAWVAHYHPEAPSLTSSDNKKGHYRVMIGPEGDFSEEELKKIQEAGWSLCTLGHRRLRTETAGLSVVDYFHWNHL